MQTHIPVVKSLSRRPKGSVLRKQITAAAKNAIAGHKHFTFDGRQTVFKDDPTTDGVDITADIVLNKTGSVDPAEEQKVIDKLTDQLSKTKWELKVGNTSRIQTPKTAKPAKNGVNGHANGHVEDEADVRPRQLRPTARAPSVEDDPVPPRAPLNFDPTNFFDHLIDRGPHVNIVTASIAAMVESGFKNRFHILITGPDGAGKTEFIHAVARMVGEGNYRLVDGPADAPRQLSALPAIVLVDDLDLFSDDRLSWLPNALAQSLVIASASSSANLAARLSGALTGQFALTAPMPAPDRSLVERILKRDVKAVDGDEKWIQPAIEYCLHKEGTLHPKRVRAVCLTGRDGLLDATFQTSLGALYDLQHPKPTATTGA